MFTFTRSVPAEKLDFMASMFRYVPLRAGQRLFEEGELGLSMYIVLRYARFGGISAHDYCFCFPPPRAMPEHNSRS